jgi:3-phosphoshikimate 1-carboxyvinyltransferase
MMSFLGQVPASKSLCNRALIIQSYFPELEIKGDSSCDDVVLMRKGLAALTQGRTVDCGDGGTTFRFLALRASRIPGKHLLKGSTRLMSRPQDELLRIFSQLGIQAHLNANVLTIESEGWKPQGDTLHVPSQRSSQFVSAVLLNSWQLPFDLFVAPVGLGLSEGYWRMTQKLSEDLGMKIDRWDQDFRIPAYQFIKQQQLLLEPDMSSAFALAAVAAVSGSVTITGFPQSSLQPDFSFVEILKKMGVPIARLEVELLRINKAPRLRGVAVKLSNSPDLFPVLAALCALSEGESELYGAPQLIFKESNRIEKTKELLRVTGRTVEVLEDGLKISGQLKVSHTAVAFDPDHDHRLAMAASVLKSAGVPLQISHPEVVNKSYPGFWQAIGWHP